MPFRWILDETPWWFPLRGGSRGGAGGVSMRRLGCFETRWCRKDPVRSFTFSSSTVCEIFCPAHSSITVVASCNIANREKWLARAIIFNPGEHDVELLGANLVCHRPLMWIPSFRVKRTGEKSPKEIFVHFNHAIVIEGPSVL